MNIIEQFPNATDEQKRALQIALDEWEADIIARGNPPSHGNVLDGMFNDFYGDITKKFRNKIDVIMRK